MNEREFPQIISSAGKKWTRVLTQTCYVPLTLDERETFLNSLCQRLVDATRAQPPDIEVAQRAGAELVESDFAIPEVLGRSVRIVGDLVDQAAAGLPDANDRVHRILEHFVVGFGRAMNNRNLAGQESVRIAALAAQARAEQALRDSEARFREFATRDQLTGLPNRTRLLERIQELEKDSEASVNVAVCWIDMDGFAKLNDGLGHAAGDTVLRVAADRLRTMETSDIGARCEIYRIEGDAFALLLPDVTFEEQAIRLAERAIASLAVPFMVDDNEVPLGASSGVMVSPLAGVEGSELVRSAAIALHWAKADGKGRVCQYEPERSARDMMRYQLSAAMPGALRRGEFTVAYQPLVNLTDGRLTGVEALARWWHPDYGLLPASRFVGLAEDTGLVVELDDFVLEKACEEAASWQALTSEMPYVSVNLAARQLHRPGLADYVAKVLHSTGLPADLLQLEITEHAVIGTDAVAVAALEDLTKLGVRIAIDDFGTGYSNLACLSVLPLDSLKLDAEFAQDPSITSDSAGHDFIATVVRLGHTLQMNVIAEGIETIKQARRMKEAGADLGQGYLFGKPAVAVDINEMIEAGRSSLLGPAARPRYAR